MKLLFVVPYTPNLIRTRPYNLVRGLCQHGHNVTLATLWENEPERIALRKLEQDGIQVISAPLPKSRSAWNALRAVPTRTPLQAVYCWQPALLPLLQAQIAHQRYDIVHIEHLRGAHYGLWLRRQFLKPNAPAFVWDSVDCISYLFEQAAQQSGSLFSRLITRLELNRTRRYEGWLVHQFDQVLVTSTMDQRALEQLALTCAPSLDRPRSTACTQVLPNGVNLDFFAPTGETREPATLVFTGKMSYHANVTAALYLINEIMPLVWAKQPQARVQIVGHRPPGQMVELGQKFAGRVQVTGTVPDVRPYLAKATLAVVPILYGAGIQNKVLEAMAMGTPVVATSKAVSALAVQDGAQLLLGDTPAEFANQIVRLLVDEVFRRRVGQNGRRFVEMSHDWRLIIGQLEKIYDAVSTGKDAPQ